MPLGTRSSHVIGRRFSWMPSRKKSPVPRGWSYPLKSAEVAEHFPAAPSVNWNGRPHGWQEATRGLVLRVDWTPDSRMEQPVLTLWAVPSTERAHVRDWLRGEVAAAVAHWVSDAARQGPVYLDTRPSATWYWPGSKSPS